VPLVVDVLVPFDDGSVALAELVAPARDEAMDDPLSTQSVADDRYIGGAPTVKYPPTAAATMIGEISSNRWRRKV
jgi:hypothetical protein